MITNTCWSRNVRKNKIKSNINLPNFPISCQEISATCIVQIKNNQPSRKYRIRNPEFFTPISQSKCNFNTTILIHVGSLPSSFSKTKHANRMFRIAPQGKRGNMKMPVSSYHGGELHVQNRIQYEYPAPESNVSDTTAGKTRYCNMKMPVSSYHGGELHVQNRAQYEYSAPRICR